MEVPMVRVMPECQGCGKRDDEIVRQCCAWEGNRTLCPSCSMNPEHRTPGHICGIGIIEAKGQDDGGND